MKKIVALLLCFVALGSFCLPACAAAETNGNADFELEIDVERRYTDISEMDDYHKTFLDVEDEEEEAKDSRKMIYIVVLIILLVVAVVIFIVSLKRVPPLDEEEAVDASKSLTDSDAEANQLTSEEKDTDI
ncbi:MAG: hypothetical protein J6Q83_01180 [Clostridia bacterium]|nr:hypothetical protein [Clostridia bacterium]